MRIFRRKSPAPGGAISQFEDGLTLKKVEVTDVYSSSSPKSVLTMLLFMAVVCVVTCIVVKGYAEPTSRFALLSATLSEAEAANDKANTLFDNSEQPDQWQTVQMRVTAYCPCKKCCGKYSNGTTASGYKIRPGDSLVAADTKFPFGTEIIINQYNNGKPVKVLDRGGAIRGNRLDVLFHSHRQAQKWGVQYLDVKVRQQ